MLELFLFYQHKLLVHRPTATGGGGGQGWVLFPFKFDGDFFIRK